MRVERLSLRDFRSYEAAELRPGPGLTVVAGRNGAGKTNLLEALYFACTGRSCRTANEREVVRFGAQLTRLELETEDAQGRHEVSVGFQPGEPKRLRADGAPVERLGDSPARPLVAVFLPDRLDLVLGAPALRRSHLDQVVAALWPARAGTRREYSAALAQRNALIAAVRAGRAGRGSMPAWDSALARHGIELMRDRAEVAERLRERFAAHAGTLGLEGEVELAYRPRSRAADGRGARRRARRAHRQRPRARLHRPRPAPRRPRAAPRPPRAALVRLARPGAARPAGAAARRARGARDRAGRPAAAAARRRDERARRRSPAAAGRRPARVGPERGHGHRVGARAGRRGSRGRPRGDRRRARAAGGRRTKRGRSGGGGRFAA